MELGQSIRELFAVSISESLEEIVREFPARAACQVSDRAPVRAVGRCESRRIFSCNFGLVVRALDHTAGEGLLRPEIVEDQRTVLAQRAGDLWRDRTHRALAWLSRDLPAALAQRAGATALTKLKIFSPIR